MGRGNQPKVVILGGGVAGMSAAHELIERGFAVEVVEKKRVAGGKARSIAAVGPSLGASPFAAGRNQERPRPGARPPLPGEHGFRFFPGFYKHIVDTMARIPYKGGNVAQNLVDTTEIGIASFGKAPLILPALFPRSSDDLKTDVFAVVAALSGQVGVSWDDGIFFATKIWQFLTSCEERRLVEYERVNWWDFVDAEGRSLAYQKFFGNGITRSLVAAKARRASTKTIGSIFMQLFFEMLMPGVAADRVLNGPTNDVWIDPWLAHLRQRGVVYHHDAEVRGLNCERGRIQSVTVAVGPTVRQISGDYFVGALPVERMAELITPSLLERDPSLANLHALTEYVEWMNGIQFYLTEDVPIARGHAIYIDTPWALTSISQPQFWKEFDLTRYGDGTVKGLLSVDISDWDVKGLNGKEAQRCSRQEIAMETWAQLKLSLNANGEVLRDNQLHSWFLDPDIDDLDTDGDPATPRLDTNAEPLLVNYVDTWRMRPEAVTRIPNFFLASDYVRTYTDLATMEAANEAARRAVNGVLRAAGSDAAPCDIWNLHEPEVFLPLRAYDRVRYRKGLPWDGQAMEFARSVVNLASFAVNFDPSGSKDGPSTQLRDSVAQLVGISPSIVGAPSAHETLAAEPQGASTGKVEETASEARASSDQGLRRMRIARSDP